MVWSGAYAIVQLIISIIFMCIDNFTKAALIIQLLLLAAYIVIVMLCTRTKEIIENVQETRAVRISNMKSMLAEMSIIASYNLSAELKTAINRLTEEFKYSDIVSSDETLPYEQRLIGEISILKTECKNDPQGTLTHIQQISEHLTERNIICKNSKKRF